MPSPRSVVVTGASSGIGQACATRLADAGFHVFAGVRSDADAERLRALRPDRIVPLRLDVTVAEQIAAAAGRVEELVGETGLAGLVNNAGIAVAGPLEVLPIARLRRQLEVNVTGQVAVTQAFLPLLRRARGRIVFMSSVAGRSTVPFIGPYAASKHALEALCDALRVELRPFHVDVVVVEPGAVVTPIWDRSLAAADEIEREAGPEAQRLYGPALERVRRFAASAPERGMPVEAVADTVLRALTARRPKTRYLLGGDSRLRMLLQHLPDRWRDRVLARRIWGDAG